MFTKNIINLLKIKLIKMSSKTKSNTNSKTSGKLEKIEIKYEEKESITRSGKLSKLDILKKYENDLINKNSNLQNNIKETLIVNENEPPKKFWKMYNLIKEMRGKVDAPVDTMGAEFCSQEKQNKPLYKFQTLVSLLLSSQTKDPITFAAMERLIKHGLTVDNIIETEEETIKDLIYGVSFHNNKAKYIKKFAQVLKDDFNGDPPETLEEVLKLPGIGPKMSYIYLEVCCGKIEGIAVDTHVHRISNRLKWVKTEAPEKTRVELQKWLPKEEWSDINLTLVGFGQTICLARGAKCEQCKLNTICEFGIERLKEKSKKKSKSKSLSKSKEKENSNTKTRKRKTQEINDSDSNYDESNVNYIKN